MKNKKTKIFYKKRFWLILFILGFCILGFSLTGGFNKKVISNINATGKNIICFGDSITRSKGADKGKEYPSVLSKLTGMQVINAGINDDTSAGGLKRLESDVLSKDPLLVIIEFAGNDFLFKLPVAGTFKNVEEMIKRIQAKGAMVAIADISSDIIMGEYREGFKKLANKYNAIFIPSVLSGIVTEPSLKSDVMHPNNQGYKIVAHRIYRQILPYLNRNALNRNPKK
jgi:acyl-CoA thioesterase I